MILKTPIVSENLILQHMLGFLSFQPWLDQLEDVITKRTNQILDNISTPIFPMKEANISTY